MAECEDSGFTFFHEHIERHLHVNQLLLKTIWDLYGSSTTKVTKNAQSWVGMKKYKSGQGKVPLVRDTQEEGGISQSQEDPP